MTHEHKHDPVSGWCGCGLRDDGRLINRRGVIYRQGQTNQQTEQAHEKAPTT
jgi:hypothetical protein